MKKRILSSILAMAMFVSCVPTFAVQAETSSNIDGFTVHTYNDGDLMFMTIYRRTV